MWEQCAEYRTGADDPKNPQVRRACPYSNDAAYSKNAAYRGSACTDPQATFQTHAPVIQPAR